MKALVILAIVIGGLLYLRPQIGQGREWIREQWRIDETRTELQRTMSAIDEYKDTRKQVPTSLAHLESFRYQHTKLFNICRFQPVGVGRDGLPMLELAAIHKEARTVVVAFYPFPGAEMQKVSVEGTGMCPAPAGAPLAPLPGAEPAEVEKPGIRERLGKLFDRIT